MKIRIRKERHRWIGWLSCLLLMSPLAGCGPTSVTDTARREEPRPAETSENPNADRYDLARDENRGGHTLSRHVARTDDQLAERLRKERNISAASTWTNRDIAEETVTAGLRAEHGRIASWMRRGERRPNLALHYDAGRPIGRSLRRSASESVPCTSAIIVLRADGPDGFYVLTTYPEARE